MIVRVARRAAAAAAAVVFLGSVLQSVVEAGLNDDVGEGSGSIIPTDPVEACKWIAAETASGESMVGMSCYQTEADALEVAAHMCCNTTCCSGNINRS